MSRKNRSAVTSRRIQQPLSPSESIFLVKGRKVLQLEPCEITVSNVGMKAFGLASIPKLWTKPFFVISGEITPTSDALSSALLKSGLNCYGRVIVRSSGSTESLDQRGALDSDECNTSEIIKTITALKEKLRNVPSNASGVVHWIVQGLINTSIKGHLSNERRLCKDHRDWVVEVEPQAGLTAETHRFGIRHWRDARKLDPTELECKYKENYC